MKTLRVGLIGTGFAGRFHAECLRRLHGVGDCVVEPAGVTSRREESRAAFGKEWDIPVFASVAEMLRHVDLLDICSPPYVHEEAILAAAEASVHVVCEKPLTGYFGPAGCGEEYLGNTQPKGPMLEHVLERLGHLKEVLARSGVMFGYAENFVYAPSVQKEREIVAATGGRILRMLGEESHNGSASDVYGIWRYQGGGSLIGKGCHPLTALLYLKRVEGMARSGRPIRPKTVSARIEELTRLPAYEDKGFIRTTYHDTEDQGWMHVIFEDGTVGDVVTGEVVLGGIYDYVEVFADNHRSRCRLNPVGMVDTFNPSGEQYRDIYTVEKISTKEGWTSMAADENITMGYLDELRDFVACASSGREPQGGFELACDTTTTIYAAYVSAEARGAEMNIPLI
jgi:predicted dehydrogenase